MKYSSDVLLLTVDLIGIFVFAVEGGMAAIRGDLDVFGLMVLSFATALGGGIIRDLLIGAVPPAAIRDWRYPATAFIGGAAVFFFYDFVQAIPPQLLVILDAAGLSLFAMAGAGKALTYGVQPFVAVLMGGITGVGGGTVRDVLLATIPIVLRADVYATAALSGAAIMIGGMKLGANRTLMTVIGGVICFVLRMASVWEHWQLPRVIAH